MARRPGRGVWAHQKGNGKHWGLEQGVTRLALLSEKTCLVTGAEGPWGPEERMEGSDQAGAGLQKAMVSGWGGDGEKRGLWDGQEAEVIALLCWEEGEGGNDRQVSGLSAGAARRHGALAWRTSVSLIWMCLSTSRAWRGWGSWSSGGSGLKVKPKSREVARKGRTREERVQQAFGGEV